MVRASCHLPLFCLGFLLCLFLFGLEFTWNSWSSDNQEYNRPPVSVISVGPSNPGHFTVTLSVDPLGYNGMWENDSRAYSQMKVYVSPKKLNPLDLRQTSSFDCKYNCNTTVDVIPGESYILAVIVQASWTSAAALMNVELLCSPEGKAKILPPPNTHPLFKYWSPPKNDIALFRNASSVPSAVHGKYTVSFTASANIIYGGYEPVQVSFGLGVHRRGYSFGQELGIKSIPIFAEPGNEHNDYPLHFSFDVASNTSFVLQASMHMPVEQDIHKWFDYFFCTSKGMYFTVDAHGAISYPSY